ncbi:MAG TPA: hypothetical protein VMU84_10250 [Thermoanaerobaculia bacterium]|nr:hypothetical protein [Thermoanaerobaculia bacterium]
MKALPVRRLSSILAAVSKELRDRFGLARLAIGGGSAPALLDHLFSGNALRMRDLDMVLVADRPVDQDLARRIGEAVDSPELKFLPRYVYPRRRTYNEREPYVAGWGLIWDSHGVEVDLSIFHSDAALELNGLMNIDRILIPISPEISLNEVAAAMLTSGSAEASAAQGLLKDSCGGYASWVHRSPAIVAWNAIHAAPIECAMRIVRACASKLHLGQLHAELADPLRASILWGHERGDRFLRVRGIVKLFHDDRAGAELEMLHAIGAFKHWLPEIGDVIEKLGHGGLATMFAQADRVGRKDVDHHAAFALAGEQGGDEVSALRLEALLLAMPEDRRDRVLEEIAIAEPMFATLVRNQLPRVEHRVKAIIPPAPVKRRPKRAPRPPAHLAHSLTATKAPVDLTT